MLGCIVALLVAGCAAREEGRIGGSDPAIAGLPDTPPMGWNSWNTFGCNVSEQIIRAQADALVASGMRDAGYRYVVVDDCWSAPDRGPDGRLRADPVRFPSGMAALGRYLHDRGLKFGIYSGARDKTCAQFRGTYSGATGSGGRERIDARTFADWGVDFLKYDWCSADGGHDAQVGAFTAMRDALRDTGRPIVYSINPNSGVVGSVPGGEFDWGGVATMTRITNDIRPVWSTDAGPSTGQGVVDIIDAAAPVTSRVVPGSFIDPDAMVVGVKGGSLTPAMQRTQMAMWAMMAAPLFASNDLTAMSPETLGILKNPDIIAIDQDGRVRAGAPVDNDPEVWSRAIGDKGMVVSLTNRGEHPRTLAVELSSLGLSGDDTVSGVDVWTGERYQASRGALSVLVGVDDTVVLEIS